MNCPKCGAPLQYGVNSCSACGCGIQYQTTQQGQPNANPQQQWQQNNQQRTNPNDAPSGGFAFLCFLIPLLGLILYLVWKQEYPLKAKSCGKGALIGVIFSVVVSIITGIIIAVTGVSVLDNLSVVLNAVLA